MLTTKLSWIAWSVCGYIGPGTGLTAIGTVLAFVAIVFLLFVGFLWYPLKRLRRRLKFGPNQDALIENEQQGELDEESDCARGLP